MRAGKLDEARQWNVESWRLKAGQHDLVSGRILFVRIALRFLAEDRAVSLYLGQLKTLLHRDSLECRADIASTWEIPDVLTMLSEKPAMEPLAGQMVKGRDTAVDAWRLSPGTIESATTELEETAR